MQHLIAGSRWLEIVRLHPGQQVARTFALVSWILSTLRFVIFREVSACSTWKEPPPPQQSLAPGSSTYSTPGMALRMFRGWALIFCPLIRWQGSW